MKAIRILIICASVTLLGGWGVRGHVSANRAAVRAIPDDGPVFLKQYEDWIAKTGPVPDSWRGNSEPYSKIFEDPNHGWFKEQFSFMTSIPRSRYEFVLRLYDEYLRIRDKDPERAALTNVRWTGTMPYAAMENYDRMKSSMRLYRRLIADKSPEAQQDAKFLAQDIAFYMGWLGHYTADGAQPLHDTIHHDGWQGPNPKQYTTDPRIHGRFESAFVDLIQLTEADLPGMMDKPKVLADPFASILAHLDDAYAHVEEVYQLDKAGAYSDKTNQPAAKLAKGQLAKAAALLRDLTYTAWVESGKPVTFGGNGGNPISRTHPLYNPQTGTAPPSGPAMPMSENHLLKLTSPVRDKNFYLLSLIEADAAVRAAIKADPTLKRITDSRELKQVEDLLWTDAQIEESGKALAALYETNAAVRALTEGPLRNSKAYIRFHGLAGAGLLQKAWADCVRGVSRAIEIYALGKPPRYPAIDSVTYDPKSDSYRRVLTNQLAFLRENKWSLDLPFSASLRLALAVMEFNHRDEAGRFEPMEAGVNAAAFQHAQSIDWSRFPYTAIVVPGAGNDRPGVRLSPSGKLRDEIAASRYRQGLAPFILVSGGYVHPNQTEYAEAIEMKADLMTRFGIPEHAIIVDPHARHTTTNIRNAARLIYRYGLPFERKVLVTTDPGQSAYIEADAFNKRCIQEMGYVPHQLLGRLNPFDLEIKLDMQSLQIDPVEPLDP